MGLWNGVGQFYQFKIARFCREIKGIAPIIVMQDIYKHKKLDKNIPPITIVMKNAMYLYKQWGR